MDVLEGRQLEGDALVHHSAGQPVQLGPGDFEQRYASVCRDLQDVAEPTIAFSTFGQVGGANGDFHLHRLQHGIAPYHPFRT